MLMRSPDIPSRYDDSILLQKATKWAVVQAQMVFAPNAGASKENLLVLLGNLLHELQLAVSDENRRFASDTLCASQMLAMLTVS
jgi:hypothetical protein